MEWVIPGQLARSHRPGRTAEGDVQADRSAVEAWLAAARAEGIRSVICLLGQDQLALYGCLEQGLLARYREEGFEVVHVDVEDAQWPPLQPSHVEQVWQAFQRLPKPVLVHCSAGLWRTGHAVEVILSRLERGG
ncbi:MAG TPA: tyrosine-protein phosphatase [Thermoanaerobaculaceae bacterium]|nr:tyrosine-protein phosphatase [Thermoanaerobaculaceae bacterium]HRS17287.1 tyrosine-protein phosphatase [Thermoanaerobaculaceae bacterium]